MNDFEATLIRLSAAIAGDDAQALETALDRAAQAGRPVEVEEAILQSYLFAGYPPALEAMRAWRARSGVRGPDTPAGDHAQWRERGERVCAQVYGGQYERLRANVAALHADLEHWMVVEGYGKVLGRPGLSMRVRELCIVALLAARHAPTQLYAHLRGALNVGATEADVEGALRCIADLVPAQRNAAALEVWRQVLQRRTGAAATDGRT